MSINPHIAQVSRMMAPDRCDWMPGWTEDHSRSYGLKEAQVQSYMDKPGPRQESGRVQSGPRNILMKVLSNSTDSYGYARARCRLVQYAG